MNPIDVVKSRLQVQGELGAATSSAYRGVFSTLLHIGKTEGIRGLYRGLLPAILFQFSGNSFRFGVYYVGKKWAADRGLIKDGKLDSRTNFAFALLSGTSAGLVCCPAFLLKTQFQVSVSLQSNQSTPLTRHLPPHGLYSPRSKEGRLGTSTSMPQSDQRSARCIRRVASVRFGTEQKHLSPE